MAIQDDGRDDSRPSTAPGEGDTDEGKRRRRLERLMPELFKRAIERGLEAGMGTLNSTNETLRGVMGKQAELPKEIASYVLGQMDETKNTVVRVVAKEVRDFLEATDLSTELQKVLTSLSFEVKTEIRFIPNDAGGLRPEVKAKAWPKRNSQNPPVKNDGDE